jgi:sphingolipid delta-4 desaturase
MPSTEDKYNDESPLVFPDGHKNAFKGDPDQPFLYTKYKKDKQSFEWVYSDEPHSTRRAQILKQYPEIRKLFGPEIKTFYIVVAITVAQFWIASWIGDASWFTFLTVMYVFGATVNHTLQLANHEISHNLVFEDNLIANVLLGIFANLATAVPSSITFRYYHMDHHIYQGVDVMDTDIPSDFELRAVTNTFTKLVWMMCQSLAYALRPVLVNPKPITKWQLVNTAIVLMSDALVWYFCGLWGLLYLFIGSLMGLGLHPVAGHFIAEHYVFVKGYETYSYYGPINYVNFNVGYHNEHHDFPKIAWSRLPRVREIAPEWYEHLPRHDSYLSVIWNYVFDPEIGPWSRVKRQTCTKFKKGNSSHHVTAE